MPEGNDPEISKEQPLTPEVSKIIKKASAEARSSNDLKIPDPGIERYHDNLRKAVGNPDAM